MKLYLHDEGFYDLLREAQQGEVISNDFNISTSEFITTVYQTNSHTYTYVNDIDNGISYSIEKQEIGGINIQ